ncbi:hypothetical protein [Bartonella melophagi]|uniref:Uncharacterized protein n=1 Tax=Bartonella melophagi K-2C TaxID=1094557 RepID=J0QZ12_9HYPH|nr:hypothetical protein [Bartonella melophagi]EJF91358.1 hypothetical protein ME3_00424 [Bartonella melophagi K-2C]EJF91366.1 hypothetical protein ME3_00432 [Bartonella melophagi K-2C]
MTEGVLQNIFGSAVEATKEFREEKPNFDKALETFYKAKKHTKS